LVETVSWEEFETILKLELDWSHGKKYGHPDSALDLLKSDLCHKEVGLKKAAPMKDEVSEVTLSNFSHVIDWHGPFFMRQHVKKILDTVHHHYHTLPPLTSPSSPNLKTHLGITGISQKMKQHYD